MIIGKKIALRALEESDLSSLRDWRNNENFRKYFREYRELNLNNQHDWFKKLVIGDDKTIMFGIVDLNSKELIGICGLCYINWIHRFADLSIYIGKDNIYVDIHEEGYAWETLNLLFEYGFNRLNINKVWCEIYEFDVKKHELFENFGFHLDGVLRENYFYDGKYQNGHIFSILSREWREKHVD